MSLSKTAFNLLLISLLFVACLMPLISTVKATTTYTYRFSEPRDEITGTVNATVTVTVTVFFRSSAVPATFSYSGLDYLYSISELLPEHFAMSMNISTPSGPQIQHREYWLDPSETGNITIPVMFNSQGITPVTFSIRALGGVEVGQYCIVQKLLGEWFTVEKRLIDDTNNVVCNLEPYTIYKVILSNGVTSFTFANINTYVTPITLTVSALSFPNDVLMQYKYLRIWASRPSSSEIQVSYEDTNEQTESVSYQIAFANGSIAYSATHTSENSFVDTWSNADSNTTYYLTANVTQTEFGSSTFALPLLRNGASTSPVDLSFLGSWPVDATQIFWALVILIVFGCFSVVNAYIGGFAGVATAIILSWLGWIAIPSGSLVAAFCIIIMVGIVYWKRRS